MDFLDIVIQTLLSENRILVIAVLIIYFLFFAFTFRVFIALLHVSGLQCNYKLCLCAIFSSIYIVMKHSQLT